MSSNYTNQLPEFLQQYSIFKEFLDREFEDLSNAAKGEKFADLVIHLLPRTELGRGIENPQKTKGSYDNGIDITGQSADELKILCVQAKYSIKRDIQEIDAIISDFERFEKQHYQQSKQPPKQLDLFSSLIKAEDEEETEGKHLPVVYFQIFLFSQRKELINKYVKSDRSSVEFFRKLENEGRIEIIDGDKMLYILQSEYRKTYITPATIQLDFVSPIIRFGDVFIGVISSTTLKQIYEVHGDAIFYENIRDFLGETSGKIAYGGRQSVNQAIAHTVRNNPEQLLSRNNGITFKASNIHELGDNILELENASIVNGCQTTVCVVNYSQGICYVLVKIVQTDDAWEITKSANRQNAPDEIDLELARFLRPQVATRVAQEHGVRITRSERNIFNVLESIYQREVAYDEVKSIFIGLFSRTPKNIFDNNYTEINYKILEICFKDEEESLSLFSKLIAIQQEFSKVFSELQRKLENIPSKKHLSEIYERIYKKPSYRAYVLLLAACSMTGIDITNKTNIDPVRDYQAVRDFLDQAMKLIETEPDKFSKYCGYAFSTIQALVPINRSREEISRSMHTYMKGAIFANLIDRIDTQALMSSD